jgi:hypothetical protein
MIVKGGRKHQSQIIITSGRLQDQVVDERYMNRTLGRYQKRSARVARPPEDKI